MRQPGFSTAVLASVEQVRIAGLFRIEAGPFDFGANPRVFGHRDGFKSARSVISRPRVVFGGAFHKVQQQSALVTES